MSYCKSIETYYIALTDGCMVMGHLPAHEYHYTIKTIVIYKSNAYLMEQNYKAFEFYSNAGIELKPGFHVGCLSVMHRVAERKSIPL